MICLDEGILRAHLDGELTQYETISVNYHLNLCNDCLHTYEKVLARSQSVSAMFAELAPMASELRTDAFAAQCALTRFKANHGVDFAADFVNVRQVVFFPNTARELQFLLPQTDLLTRLRREFLANWQEFKRDPQAYLNHVLRGERNNPVRRCLLQKGTAAAMASYVLLVATLIIAGGLRISKPANNQQEDKLTLLGKLMAPTPPETTPKNPPEYAPKGSGGISRGDKPQIEHTGGGGGGGRNEIKPATQGVTPQFSQRQIMLPDPYPPKSNSSLVLPDTLLGDPKLSRPMPGRTGLEDGAIAPPSSGTGSNGGMGNSNGKGLGPGNGDGLGPGESYGKNGHYPGGGGRGSETGTGYDIPDATQNLRPTIFYKEKAKYTEEARENRVQGSVVLSVIFGTDGRIYGIQTIRGLPHGLTEKALEAARRIKFRPAVKNGQPIAVRMQLEFSFNLL